ncbi:MAG: hypothetical protein ACLGJD_13595 [Gammaproteobacteria bacterium]
MDTPANSAPSAVIEDLFRLTLADGLPAQSGGKTIRYRVVHLRETGVAHERKATRQAERVVMVGAAPKLLVSEADFRLALTAQHIEAFECDGVRLGAEAIDLDVIGRLSTHDFGLIEQRTFLIGLAAELRYGNITQATFDAVMRGEPAAAGGGTAPRPVGQAGDVGAPAQPPQPGPAMLADFAGGPAAGAPSGAGR